MQQPTIETPRLLIRELLDADAEGMFALDSNANVHRYLGNNPIKTIEEAKEIIGKVRKQYKDLGIGRWAMIEKNTGEFIGWTGFKLNTEPVNGHHNFLDLGYRLREEFWGKGYATESAFASLNYICTHGKHDSIYGMAEIDNEASNVILNKKVGMHYVNSFMYDTAHCHFYEITKAEWLARN
ncbi:GNAT family N-acetyltransferase [Aureisphaera sp. CAU 1614]|uniref:GNAT family N-acetyltransferase n=1 Tax=Halomarinibacterium sedimenti TaxID=2857106 RepID=A0A9X1FQ47_9FLAO|nr:GNAT family N-acetyltransferase [Halomarinibacterium sedimenti]MBW2938378.1 GNAT family N-acetyltransferase [Halomarinibacterium sedimenti]